MPRKLHQRILEHVARSDYRPVKTRALARQMGIAEGEYGDFRQALKTLRDAGRLLQGRGHAVLPPEGGNRVIGQYRAHPRGFGFIIPETPDVHGDLFVPQGAALDAVTGDTVLARVTRAGRRGGQMLYRGRVLEVLARGHSRFVGRLDKEGRRWYVRPDGNLLHVPVLVGDLAAAGARRGDQVVFEMTAYPGPQTPARGVITEVLGPRGRPGVDVRSVIRQYGLPDTFDEPVLAEARRVVDRFDPQAAAKARQDLRHRTVITIDPDEARDFDDAISLRETDHGLYELGVHIADVAHFVTQGSLLDAEARLRGNSVYFPRHVVPMLPELLSNGLCSLQEDEPRLTKSVLITYDATGRVRATRLANTVIRSMRRLTYGEAELILQGKTGGVKKRVVELVRRMERLARLIQRRRLAEGMLVLELPEVELVLDDEGRVTDARPADRSFGHTIIEMFMVEANEAVARKLHELGVPALRRVHPPPDAAAQNALGKYLRLLGLDLPRRMDRFDLQRLLNEVRGTAKSFAVNLAVLRSLQQAVYSPEPIGHFALAGEHYTHFTSPIRRYPDLAVHRLVDRYLRGELPRGATSNSGLGLQEVAELGRHCSFTERRAADAERELERVKLLELLSRRLGEQVCGVVTGVAQFGAFVQIERFPVDGLVPVADLPDDWWQLDARGGRLVGQMSGQRIAIGDVVRVRIAAVDITARRLDLAYLSHGSSSGRKSAGAGSRRKTAEPSAASRATGPAPAAKTANRAKPAARKAKTATPTGKAKPRRRKGATRPKRRSR